jgi:hypothetical protein
MLFRKVIAAGLSVLGAALGGVLGHYAFRWIWSQGFYAPMVPGGFLGMGCAALSGHKSTLRGMLCVVAGLGLGLFSRWTEDAGPHADSFKDFATHFYELRPLTLALLALGGLIAFWCGQGYVVEFWRRQQPKVEAQRQPEQ